MKLDSLSNLKTKIIEIVEKKSTIGIITHKKPDGDGLGAAFALQEILLDLDQSSDIILDEKIPQLYSFLDGDKRTKVYKNELSYNTIIVLDCHEKSRLGRCEPLINKADDVIIIDHHMESKVIDSVYYINAAKVMSAIWME